MKFSVIQGIHSLITNLLICIYFYPMPLPNSGAHCCWTRFYNHLNFPLLFGLLGRHSESLNVSNLRDAVIHKKCFI